MTEDQANEDAPEDDFKTVLKPRNAQTSDVIRLNILVEKTGVEIAAKSLGITARTIRSYLRKCEMPLTVDLACMALSERGDKQCLVHFWTSYPEALVALTFLERLGFDGKIMEASDG